MPPPDVPTTEGKQQALADNWLDIYAFPIPGIVGALDGTLICILTPPRAVKIAFNTRKCFYGVTLMAICDAKKRFLRRPDTWIPHSGNQFPPSQEGTRGFASWAVGSGQSETAAGSREGNMSD